MHHVISGFVLVVAAMFYILAMWQWKRLVVHDRPMRDLNFDQKVLVGIKFHVSLMTLLMFAIALRQIGW